MNKFLVLSLACLISAGCGGAATNSTNTNSANINSAVNKSTAQSANVSAMPQANVSAMPPSDSTVVSSHSNPSESLAPPSAPAKSTESPMARPIDVAALNADIEKAEKEYKKNPAAKDELAKAYFLRATALTEAAQYRSALGDYRRGLKLDPSDETAKSMHGEILRIFQSINREPPKEGEEPAPLPMK